MNDYTQRLEKIEAVLKKKLPFMFSVEWKETAFNSLDSAVTDAHLNNLVEPCRNLLLLGGKRWRPLLLVLCAELGGSSPSDTIPYELTGAVEFIHTASLIHDDIEDGADLRRGKPAAHITWGVDTAINSASWLFFEAFSCLSALPLTDALKTRLYGTMSAQVRRLHLGQSMDISWHKSSVFPTRAEYEAMIRLKTGTLANLAAQLGLLYAGASAELAEKVGMFAADIGAGFQILDDVINITTGNPGKKRGDDITEGKKSLPVLLHIEKKPEDEPRITACFTAARKNGINAPEVEECIMLLHSSSAAERAKEYAAGLIHGACAGLEKEFAGREAMSLISRLFKSMLN